MDSELDRLKAPKGKLIGWLGLRRSSDRQIDRDDPSSTEAPAPARNISRDARHMLLQQIIDFLISHDLEVSQKNLIFSYNNFSGAQPRMARIVNSRLESGGLITQDWIDNLLNIGSEEDEQRDIEKMIMRLETQVETFQTQARQARNITVQYGSDLEQHVDDLSNAANPSELVSDLADLARAMLERTRRAETDMRRSEEEVRKLRRNLARARRDAEIDHLTGLPNRRAFEALLEQQYREAQEEKGLLSVAFCDIDEFKRINDTHGHDAGDRVIKVIADTLARISDDRCHVARHGGEEFVMLFRGLTPKEAAERLNTAREAMAQRKLINRKTDQPFGQVTFSGGVADVFGFDDMREALRAADQALYRAKKLGRNRIELAD